MTATPKPSALAAVPTDPFDLASNTAEATRLKERLYRVIGGSCKGAYVTIAASRTATLTVRLLTDASTFTVKRAQVVEAWPTWDDQRAGRILTDEERAENERRSMARMAGWEMERRLADWTGQVEAMARTLRRAADDLERDLAPGRAYGPGYDGRERDPMDAALAVLRNAHYLPANMNLDRLVQAAAGINSARRLVAQHGQIEESAEAAE